MQAIEFECQTLQGSIKIPEKFQEWQNVQSVTVILLRHDESQVSPISETDYLALMERFAYAQMVARRDEWKIKKLNGLSILL
jgi:hypothetical protein